MSALQAFVHYSFKIDFHIENLERRKRVRVHRVRSPWFATPEEALMWVDEQLGPLWHELEEQWPGVLCSIRLRERNRLWPAHARDVD